MFSIASFAPRVGFFFVPRIWAVAAFIIFCASIDDRKHYASKGRNKQFQFSNMPISHKTDESNA